MKNLCTVNLQATLATFIATVAAAVPAAASEVATPQAAGSSQGVGEVLFWVGIGIVLLVTMGFAILRLRRWLFLETLDPHAGQTLMEDLRGMRERGEISEDEFQRIRQTMIAKAKADADREPG